MVKEHLFDFDAEVTSETAGKIGRVVARTGSLEAGFEYYVFTREWGSWLPESDLSTRGQQLNLI